MSSKYFAWIEEKFIFRLSLYNFNLSLYIFNLKPYVFSLKIDFPCKEEAICINASVFVEGCGVPRIGDFLGING